MPKLRRNRRGEIRWSLKYHAAVRNAVFMTQPAYIPTEPPPFVKEHADEYGTLYMCPQCKDCFHFRSSLEDHIARKSWILGFWCQQCFATICTHNPGNGTTCSECIKLDWEKRSYLRKRGLRKNQKCGAVRVFYNQCQFFAHLKAHNVNFVHMAELMLMPIPTNLNTWSPTVNTTCEALMEHTFIIKVHIKDWLNSKNIDKIWWDLNTDNIDEVDSSVAIILNGYKGHLYFEPLKIPTKEQCATLNSFYSLPQKDDMSSDIEIIDSTDGVDKTTSSCSMNAVNTISNESNVENNNTSCPIDDITFVDCGPTPQCFEPETSPGINRNRDVIASTKSKQSTSNKLKSPNVIINRLKRNGSTVVNSIPSDVVMSYGNTVITPKRGVNDLGKCSKPVQLKRSTVQRLSKGVVEGNVNKKAKRKSNANNLIVEPLPVARPQASCATKSDAVRKKLDKTKQNVHTLTVSSGHKVVTFQRKKRIDINSIIDQLPSRIIRKKFVLMGQSNDSSTSHDEMQESVTKMVVHVMPEEHDKLVERNEHTENEKQSDEKAATGKSVSNNLGIEFSKGKSQSSSNKVVYQNGRKYIIKQSQGLSKSLNKLVNKKQGSVQFKSTNGIPALIPLNSTELEKMNTFHQDDVSPLTPSPSPSELSSSSSCEVQSKKSSGRIKITQKSESSTYLSSLHQNGMPDPNSNNTLNSCESLTFHKGEDKNLYLDIKFLSPRRVHIILDTPTMISKCREEMLNEFFHLSYTELRKRYEHLQETRSEVSRVMNFVTDNVVSENLKAINILQTVLKHCIDKCSNERPDEPVEDDTADEQNDPLHKWEHDMQMSNEKTLCKACNKIMKPKQYTPGFSKPAVDDTLYCSCYRNICHKCNSFQGNSTRFVAHQSFHDKEKPYLCPDCYRKFSTYKSLEVHTWTTCCHTLKKRVLGCKICEIDGFQDMESVARHFAVMHSYKKIACDGCNVILPTYSAYKKHHSAKHPEVKENQQPVRLALCKLGRCVVRCEDYMHHMERHSAVERLIWFKCPFCSFIHAEAKKTMFHLRTVHDPRMKELVNPDVLQNVLQVESAAKMLKNNSQQKKFAINQAVACNDKTMIPKIVNARTITSEVFESDLQLTDDYLMNDDAPQCSKTTLKESESSKANKIVPKILSVKSMATLTPPKDRNEKKESTSTSETSMERMEIKKSGGKRTKGSQLISIKDIADNFLDDKNIDLQIEDADVKILSSDDSILKMNGQLNSSMENASLIEKEKEQSPKINQSNDRYTLISKPPPLARIPQDILDIRPNLKGQSTKLIKPGCSSNRLQKIYRHFIQRIDLTGPKDCKTVYNFSCHLCGESINTSKSVITNHFQHKHEGECKLATVATSLLRMSSDFIIDGYKDLLGNRKRKTDSNASNAKRRKRWTPKKYSDGKNVGFAGVGLCVEQETAEDGEGNFRCKKCDKCCSDMKNLREHIAKSHRIKGRFLVCLECGDNFVVAPSLQMHLKAFHGIDDPITYMARNTDYAPDDINELECEGKSIEANQCHVCMAVFEDKAAVDKHLRVHGMAFLNRKRIEARNALKSPDSKNSGESEKRNSIDEQEQKSTGEMENQLSIVQTSLKETVRKETTAETILEKISATI